MKKTLLSIVAVAALFTSVNAQQTSDEATRNVDADVLASSNADAPEGWSKGGVFGFYA